MKLVRHCNRAKHKKAIGASPWRLFKKILAREMLLSIHGSAMNLLSLVPIWLASWVTSHIKNKDRKLAPNLSRMGEFE
jgi:hemerythrin